MLEVELNKVFGKIGLGGVHGSLIDPLVKGGFTL